MHKACDVLIVGGGIVGLTLALQIRRRAPSLGVIVLEKETSVGLHSSGRNSGVLHSGIYYASTSLKAKFCIEGNRRMAQYCTEKHLPINRCGKLVIATNDDEAVRLKEIHSRALMNGCTVRMVSHQEAEAIEPNIRCVGEALFAPDTSTIDPKAVVKAVLEDVVRAGVEVQCGVRYVRASGDEVETSIGSIRAKCVVNCAGLYADKIAHDRGLGSQYGILPFKGLYLKYTKNKSDVITNVYPVPDLKFPFLGVHFTKTVDGTIKIGPTAVPALWRENYKGFSRFDLGESLEILSREARLFILNSFHFRDLAFEEMKRYHKHYFVNQAKRLLKNIDERGFTEWTEPGIRAQLLNLQTGELVQDFVVEGDERSVHVLNAVSPGFTCAFPFADYLIDEWVAPRVGIDVS